MFISILKYVVNLYRPSPMLEYVKIGLGMVGLFGPVIQIAIALFILRNKNTMMFYYITGLITNSILNIILKGIIKQPRPIENNKLFNLIMTNGKSHLFKNGVPYDRFGMPSGHTQMALFSTVFMYLFSKRNTDLLILFGVISLFTIIQRVIYKQHSIAQVIIGSVIGGIMGYIAYYFACNGIQKKYTEKTDDGAPK
jgi:membrane-associated phospholipid phosphatase